MHRKTGRRSSFITCGRSLENAPLLQIIGSTATQTEEVRCEHLASVPLAFSSAEEPASR